MFGFKDKCTLSVAEILGVATAVAGRRDLNDVIRSVSGDVQAFLTHDHFDAAILAEDKANLQAFETGLDTEWGGTTRTVHSSPIRAIFQADASYIVTDDAQIDPRFQQEGMYAAPLFEAGLHARLHVAMTINGEVIGALSFSRTTPTPYSEADVANALVVSRLISPYVHGLLQADRVNQARLEAEREARLREGLREGARALTNNLEKTRAQIGMELHDQTLADLSRILRTLSDKEELASHEITQLRADVNHCLVELRRIVDDARPSVLELFGMPEAVRQQIERESALQPSINITFDDQLNELGNKYSADIEFGIYRIAQEAIHNAFKHSDATQINVALSDEDGNIALSVSDNGCGFEEAQWRDHGGVFNMQTRAALFGANLEIKPAKPTGTHILLRANSDQMRSQGASS